MTKSKTNNPIKLIEDRVLNLHESDDFGHIHISEILREIIVEWGKKDPHDLTVGLLGGWGTGKSSIGESLEKSFENDDSTRVVTFDVWKHEAGSFRREFLTTFTEKLGVDNLDVKRLYLSKSQAVPTGEIILNKILPLYILIGFITLLIVYLGSYVIGEITPQAVLGFYKNLFIEIIGGITVVSLVTPAALEWLKQFNLFNVQKITLTKEPVRGIEEFSSIYADVVNGNHGYKRIVVIIDNLDRVSDDKAIELLTAIKTYLCNKNVAFIVQCDEDAVIRHLRNYYQYKQDETQIIDEFLRKFFNVNLRIPPLYSGDLEDFARKALAKTNLPGSNSLIAVIAQAHKDNPRKIIQFINSLQTAYKLAMAREGAGTLQPKGVVTEQVPMLAKVLIFQRDFRLLFEGLKKNPHYWLNLQEYIVGSNTVSNKYFPHLLKDDPNLSSFLKTTESVLTQDIEPFIFLKTPNGAVSIPGSAKMLEYLGEENIEEFDKVYREIGSELKDNFERLLLDKLQNTVNDSIVRNTIHSYITYAKSRDFSMHHTITERFVGLILNPHRFGPLELFELKNLDYLLANGHGAIQRKRLFEHFISLLKGLFDNNEIDQRIPKEEYKIELTKYLAILLDKEKDSSEIQTLKNNLQQKANLSGEVNSLENLHKLFELPQSVQEVLVNSINHKDFISEKDNILPVDQKFNLIENNSENKYLILERFRTLQNEVSSITKVELAQNIFRTFKKFIAECNKDYSEKVLEIANGWTFLYTKNEVKEQAIVMEFLLFLYGRLLTYEVELTAEMQTLLTHYINSVPSDDLINQLKHIPSTDRELILEKNEATFKARVAKEDGFLLQFEKAGLMNRETLEDFACRKIVDTDDCLDVVEMLLTKTNYFNPERVANSALSRMNHHVQNRFELTPKLAELVVASSFKEENIIQLVSNTVKDRVRNRDIKIIESGLLLLDIYLEGDLLKKEDVKILLEDHLVFLNNQVEPHLWSTVTQKYYLLARKNRLTELENSLTNAVFDFYFRHRSLISLGAVIDFVVNVQPRFTKHDEQYKKLFEQIKVTSGNEKNLIKSRIDELRSLKNIKLPANYLEDLNSIT